MHQTSRPSVFLISVDALRPELVFNAEKIGIGLPNLRKLFVENGTYASKGVKSVFPSWTYDCHQSIITGTYPATHGIHTNKIFDPEGRHMDAWYWHASDKVPTLWEKAKENGYLSVNVGFPTSVGADADYNIVEYWRDGTELDSKIIDIASRPQGIIREIENAIGQYPGLDWSLASDRKRFQAALWMLENKVKSEVADKPFFMTLYLASYDDIAHHGGTYCKEALDALQEIDSMIGELIAKAHEVANDNIVTCVISDHGMMDNIADIRPNTIFEKAGLIKADESGKVVEWDAWCQRGGGTSQIRLKHVENEQVRKKVEEILYKLKNDENSGVLDFITGTEAKEARKGYPDADYVLIAKAGYEFREDAVGEYMKNEPTQGAQHGYLEEWPEMKASFFIEGVNIEKNKDVEGLNLVDIAPTLAKIMEFAMKTAEGKNIL